MKSPSEINQGTIQRLWSFIVSVLVWVSIPGTSHAAPGDWRYSGYQSSPPPAEIAVPMTNVSKIAAGYEHTVALKNDGTVVAWGHNGYGQTTVPGGLSGVTAIAAGGHHTVALKNDGAVVAWGYNGSGQTTVPGGLSGVTAIAAGGAHTVALKNDGTVVAWGDNGSGQTTVPAGLTGVTAIAAGGSHTVALKNDGTVVAWGYNGYGQATVPSGLSGVTAIAAGYQHTVALKNDGTLVAWGNNGSGQTTVPGGLTGVTAIAAGGYHTVALKNDGTVVAWGYNGYGQATVPAVLSGVTAIAAGGSHTVVLKNDGTVVTWGYNAYGQTTVPGRLSDVSAIATGDSHTAALKSDGTVVAWGYNDYGQATVPGGLSGVSSIAAGYYHTGALKNDGTVVAWGQIWGGNSFGQIMIPFGLSGVFSIASGHSHMVALKNNGTVVAWGYNGNGQTTVPGGLTGVTAIGAGGDHTVALKNDGTVVAWGSNSYGQTTVPGGLTGVSAIAAGRYHTVALKNDGTVVAWGNNSYGQTTVPGELSGVSAIAAGAYHTVALKNDGTVVAWGYNGHGQTTIPGGLSGITAIAAGSSASVTFYREGSAAPLPGQLDVNFSSDGKTTIPVGNGDDWAWDVAVQDDGKIVLGGFSTTSGNADFGLARLHADGSLDSGFGTGGKVSMPISTGGDICQAVAIQADGKIVAAGYSWNGNDWEFAVMRFLANGTLDTSFGDGGKLRTPIGIDNDIAYDVAIQPDGKIVLGGYAIMGGVVNAHFALVRYLPNGTLDTSFSSDGIQTTAIGGVEDRIQSLVIQPDGKIVAAGYSYNGSNRDIALARYNPDGSLDTSFDGDGKLTTTVGSLDDIGRGIALQPDGKILVTGWSGNGSNNDMVLLRYTTTGSLDTTFNGTGKIITTYGSSNDYGHAVAVQPNGKLVVAGYSNNGSNDDFALSRYLPDGSLDSSFGSGGKIRTPIGSGHDAALGIALQNDGRIVAAGYSWNGSNYDMAVARYQGDESEPPLVNGGFEVVETLGGFVPTSMGDWGQDLASIVTTENGIQPYQGTRMAKFNATAPSGPGGTAAEIVQFVDLSGYSSEIAAGRLRLTLTNRVNRLAGNGNTDTLFGNSITARDGSLNSGNVLGSSSATLISDANPSTWEMVGNSYKVPVGTTHVLVSVHAIENVLDDAASPEFSGHYVDDVQLNLTTNEAPAAENRTVRAPVPDYGVTVYSAASDVTDPDGDPVTLSIVGHTVPGTVSTDGSSVQVSLTSPITADVTITVRATDSHGSYQDSVIVLTARPPGTVDPTFDGDGTGTAIPSGYGMLSFPGVNAVAKDVKVQPDGKVVAVGYKGTEAVVARFNANGTVDSGFGTGGSFAITSGTSAVFRRMALQADGKIVAVGYSIVSGNGRYLVARFTASGVPDASFDGDGMKIVDVGPSADIGTDVAIQPDGKIVLSGYSYTGSAYSQSAVRLLPDGAYDTSFDGDGKVTVPYAENSLADAVTVMADGKIVLAGHTNVSGSSDFCAARLLSNGSLDTSFGSGGKRIVSLSPGNDFCEAMTVQADGKLLLGGRIAGPVDDPPKDFALLRLDADGNADGSFGTDGKLVFPASASFDTCWDLAVQSDGKIVAVGIIAGSFEDMAVVRFLPNGTPDSSFDSDGILYLAPGNLDDGLMAVEVEADGDIIAGGYSDDASGAQRMAVVKLNGFGAEPDITVEHPVATELTDGGPAIDCGLVAIGQTVSKTFTIRNSGFQTLHLTPSVTVSVPGSYIDNPISFTSLAPGASGEYTFTFQAQAPGAHTATLRFISNDADESPFDITLTCEGTAPEIAVFNGAAELADGQAQVVDLGETVIGNHVVHNLTIHNQGNAPLTLSAIQLPSGLEIQSGTPALPVTIPAGTSIPFGIFFGTQIGVFQGSVGISCNDPDEAVFNFPVSAVVNGIPEIALEHPVGVDLPHGSGLQFGTLASGRGTAAKTVTIKNTGNGPLAISSISITGANASEFPMTAPAAPLAIAPGGQETLTITFTPTGTASGGRFGTLEIHCDDPDESLLTRSLEGLGLSTTADNDGDGMNDWVEYRLAGVGFDWNVNQAAMVTALYDGANDAGLYTPSQVQALHLGTPLISRNPTTGKFKLTMDWKKSTNLADFFDFPAPANSVSVNPQGDIEFEFTSPDDAAFFRVEAR